jgi:hypothetical protein
MPSVSLRALSLLHLCWREWLLHVHEASLRDFQLMSVSSSTLREAILYTWCLAGTPIEARMRHVIANQNIAVCLTPPCLVFVSDFDLERIRPAELCVDITLCSEFSQEHTIYFDTALVSECHRKPLIWMETQNPRADMSVVPFLTNSSIAQRSWLSSSGDQVPCTNAVSDVNSTVLETYCTFTFGILIL